MYEDIIFEISLDIGEKLGVINFWLYLKNYWEIGRSDCTLSTANFAIFNFVFGLYFQNLTENRRKIELYEILAKNIKFLRCKN